MSTRNKSITKAVAIFFTLALVMVGGVFFANTLKAPNLNIWTEQPEGINVCSGVTTFSVHIKNLSVDDIENVVLYPQLPQGVEYQPGSATAQFLNGNPIATVSDTGEANPGISLGSAEISVEAGVDEVIITFQASANCELLSVVESQGNNLVSNDTKVRYNLKSDGAANTQEELEPNSSTSYDVLIPALQYYVDSGDDNLSLTNPGQKLNRNITIRNTGTGTLDKLTVNIDHDAEMEIEKLWLVQGPTETELLLTTSSSGHKEYEIDLAAMGITVGSGEEVQLKDEVSVVDFKPSIQSEYSAKWGCGNEVCNISDTESVYLYINTAGSPSIVTTYQNVKSANMCDEMLVFEYTMTNNGSGNLIEELDAAFNIEYLILFNELIPSYDAGLDQFHIYLDDPNIAWDIDNPQDPEITHLITEGAYNATYSRRTDKLVFESASNSSAYVAGLRDLNSDGVVNDLPVGSSINIIITYTPKLTGLVDYTDRPNSLSFNGNLYSKYYDWENDAHYGVNRIFFHDSHYSIEKRTKISSPDFNEGNTENLSITFNASKSARNLDADGYYLFNISLPQGYELDINSVTEGLNTPISSTQITQIGQLYSIEYPLVSYSAPKINIDADISMMDCDGTSGNPYEVIEWNVEYVFSPNCPDDKLRITGDQQDIVSHCTLCTGVEMTAFGMDRNTFGWEYVTSAIFLDDLYVDQLYDKVNKDTEGIELKSVYPRDEMLLFAEGQLNGSELYDDVSFELSYTSPTFTNLIEFSDTKFILDGTDEYLVNPSSTIVDPVSGLVTVKFTLDQSITQTAFEFEGKVSILYDADVRLLAKGIYSLDFGANFSGLNQSNTLSACLAYSQDIDLLIPTVTTSYTSLSYKCEGRYSVYPHYVNSATLQDDFPNEFRPVSYNKSYTVKLPLGYSFNQHEPVESYAFGAIEVINDQIDFLDNRTLVIGASNKFAAIDAIQYSNTGHRIYFSIIKDDDYVGSNTGSNRLETNNDVSLTLFPTEPLLTSHFVEDPVIQTFALYDHSFADLSLSANSVQEALGGEVSWPVQLCNNTNSTLYMSQEKIWVAMEVLDDDPSTIIEGAKDIQGNALDVQFYGPTDALRPDGKYMMVEVGALQKGQCKTINLTASYAECEEDRFQNVNVLASYGCDYPYIENYEGKISDRASDNFVDESIVSLRYKNAEIQWTIESPVAEVDMCTPATFDIDLNSVLFGTMTDINLLVDLPEYTSISSAEFLYPANPGAGGTYQPVTFGLNAEGQSTLHVAGTGGILTDGLPGTQTGQNIARIKVNVETSCGFDPGQPILYTVDGITNCGDEKSLSDQRKINISGLSLDQYDIAISATEIASCQDSNEVTFTITNTGDNLNGAGELLILIPSEVQYESLISSDLGNPISNELNALGREIKWNIPESIMLEGNSKTVVISTSLGSQNVLGEDVLYYARTSMTGEVNCGGSNCPVNATTGEANYHMLLDGIFPQVEITADQAFPVCIGTRFILTANILGVEDVSGYTFSWDHLNFKFNNGFLFNSQRLPVRAFAGTIYTVVVTDPQGCSSLATIEIPVVEGEGMEPVTIFSELDCDADPDAIVLYVPFNQEYTYEWSKDNVFMPEANSATYFATEPGNYRVLVSNRGGCGQSDDIDVIFNQPLDASFSITDDLIQLGEFSLFFSSSHIEGNTYHWDFGNGETRSTGKPNLKYRYRSTGEFTVTLTVENSTACDDASSTGVLEVYDPLCQTDIPLAEGAFYIDQYTGNVVFKKDDCPGDVLLSCISGERDPTALNKVVSASAVTYSDRWSYDHISNYAVSGLASNAYELGEKGKWRPSANYAFKQSLEYSGQYKKDGTYSLEFFNWQPDANANSSKWISTSVIELYSPNGEPLQERNALGIPSTVKMGYEGALPYLTANNAEYSTVDFVSFEDENGYTEDELDEAMSHSGFKSLKMPDKGFKLPAITLNHQVIQEGFMVKAWVYNTSGTDSEDFEGDFVIGFRDKFDNAIIEHEANLVAQVDGWVLLSANIDHTGDWTIGDEFRAYVNYTGEEETLIDDVRIQPADAEMSAYVYDPLTLKLLAVFDDQHFGMFYQYNPEGKLVRKQIETEEGKRTIQETQYNIPRLYDRPSIN